MRKNWDKELLRARGSFLLLLEIAPEVNRARDELRAACEVLAGGSLDGFSIQDCLDYVELGQRYLDRIKQEKEDAELLPKAREVVIQAQICLDGVNKAIAQLTEEGKWPPRRKN